jgi:hypothetical protein
MSTLKEQALEQMKAGVRAVIEGTETECKTLLAPSDIMDFLVEEYDAPDWGYDLESNGWQYDYWARIEIEGHGWYKIWGSGWYGGTTFEPCDDEDMEYSG